MLMAVGILAVGVMAWSVFPGQSFAQDSGAAPTPLFSVAPPASVESEDTRAPAPGTGATGAGIEVEALDRVGATAVGLVDARSGGLPADIWQRSHPEMPSLLISQLPDLIASPALRALAIRLLVTAAPLPTMPGAVDRAARAGDFLAARIGALTRIGAPDEAVALSETLSRRERAGGVRRAIAEAALAADDPEPACADSAARTAEGTADDGDGFWARLQVFCQIRAGDLAGAELSAQLLQDLGQAGSLFMSLSDALISGYAANLTGIADADPIEQAMLAHLKSHAETGSKPAKPTLATLEDLVAGGHATVEELSEAYAGADVTAAALDDPVASALKIGGAEARALLYQAATIQSVPAAKVELIRAALESARAEGRFIALAPAFADLINGLKADNSLWRFAGLAARFHYALGQPAQARPWHGVLRTRTLGDPDAAGEHAGLWPYSILSGALALEPATQGLSAAGQAWRGTAVAARRQGGIGPDRALALMNAIGLPISALTARHVFSDDRGEQRADGIKLDPLKLIAMRAAARDGKTGDAIALAILALGGRAPEAVDGPSLAPVLETLAQLGLSADSRALALEALP